ncbi:hypothetical protein KJA16_02645 [Patescibacteria group bacterium]|nr:hypothetical protein [Patescibacteria group bacterium]
MKKVLILFIIPVFCFLAVPLIYAQSASLYLAPSRGTFFVGGTFNVSIYLDTKGNEINVIEVDLKFPPDILQVTAPTAGESFISEWIVPPNYSNIGGKISFKGGIPEGIVTTAGLVSTITFRAKSPGKALVEFLDSSKVLLADGKGTPIFTTNIEGIYEVLVPPPEGPKISSPTHPDPEIWYSNSSPNFSWEKEKGVTDFSFVFSQNSQENPDTVSEGNYTFKSYDEVSDGVWYFHLRSKKEGVWGRTSHLAVRIDTNPPQKFTPTADTFVGFVYFEIRDFHSGIDFYEISVLNISQTPNAAPFFVEATSPFKIPERRPGKYSIIVRAHDKAGNYQTSEIRFQMLSPIISIEEGGIRLRGIFFPRWVIFLILFILIGGSGYLTFHFSRRRAGFKKGIKEIKEALKEIEKVEEREKEIERLKKKFKEEKEKLEEKLIEK